MKVKLTKTYKCAPEGHTVLVFEAGEVVEGKIAKLALADKAGKEVKESKPKKTKPAKPEITK